MCGKNDANKVVQAVWSEFSKVMKNGITQEELNLAKCVLSDRHVLSTIFSLSLCRKKLQVSLQMASEQSADVFSTMLAQPEMSDRLTDVQSIVQQLERADFSADSINQLAKKILTGKPPTLVSIGNLKTMPFVDDLKA